MIIIKGRIPSKKNSRINTKSGRSFPSSKYTSWHKDASLQIKSQKVETINTKKLKLVFHLPDNRRTDLTNKAESVMDLLVDLGLLEDDSWQIVNEILLVGAGVDKENPRVEISYN